MAGYTVASHEAGRDVSLHDPWIARQVEPARAGVEAEVEGMIGRYGVVRLVPEKHACGVHIGAATAGRCHESGDALEIVRREHVVRIRERHPFAGSHTQTEVPS